MAVRTEGATTGKNMAAKADWFAYRRQLQVLISQKVHQSMQLLMAAFRINLKTLENISPGATFSSFLAENNPWRSS